MLIASSTISIISKTSFIYLTYNFINLYRLNKLKHLYNTAGQIDLSYEILDYDKLINNKNKHFLIAATTNNTYSLGNFIEKFNNKTLEIIKLNNKAFNIVEIKKNKLINVKYKLLTNYIDAHNISSYEINKDSVKNVNLSLLNKLIYFVLRCKIKFSNIKNVKK